GCRGLLLQRLPQFIEQPRILDGDDGLGGEVRHQRYLLLGEWSDLLAVNPDKADYFRVPEHRDAKQSANAGDICGSDRQRVTDEIGRVDPQIGHLNRPTRGSYSGQDGLGARSVSRSTAPLITIRLRQVTIQRSRAEGVLFAKPHQAIARLAQVRRLS